MKQYCRYCSALVTGNGIYCTEKNETMSESKAKRVNSCPHFNLNPMDAFFENEKGYQPREPKQNKCEGQIDLFGKEQGC